ncbi:MAG TPA: efflux RND transporter periplasmic adaptor subunit [Candidatus Polarisedimenticolaceae bacterium]|nr:efflux RND transporter periplasmic adaptor subunit [Candidatus Polarisedimenticolaceae bacterium]
MTCRRRLAALAVGSLLLSAGCGAQGNDRTVEFRVPVFVEPVRTGTVEDRIVATGTLRSLEIVSLRADTGGALAIASDPAGRRLAEGSRVDAGQVVAVITGEEVRLAAGTDATRQRYEAARRDYESKKELFDEGLLSEELFRQVETALAESKIEWERSLLTEARSSLVTPIGGVILRLARDENGTPLADGQLVTQGFVVAQIAPATSLIADVDLVGRDVARVVGGMPARIRHHAWEDQAFDGRVLRLAPALDPVTRTLRAEVAVQNPEGRLRPGMFVEVTLIAERREDVAVVPREAVTERGGRKVVFVLNGQKVNQRDVGVGLGDDEVIEIRQGVEPGERIVVRGLETLTDGTSVRPTGA